MPTTTKIRLCLVEVPSQHPVLHGTDTKLLILLAGCRLPMSLQARRMCIPKSPAQARAHHELGIMTAALLAAALTAELRTATGQRMPALGHRHSQT